MFVHPLKFSALSVMGDIIIVYWMQFEFDFSDNDIELSGTAVSTIGLPDAQRANGSQRMVCSLDELKVFFLY